MEEKIKALESRNNYLARTVLSMTRESRELHEILHSLRSENESLQQRVLDLEACE